MKIINAKLLYNTDKFRIFENSNFQGDEFIATEHPLDPKDERHSNTRLSVINVVTKKRTPILRDWCDNNRKGLEDVYWLKNINGYDYFGAEAKPYGANGKNIDQTDIDIFKCVTGTHDWKYILSIKPTNNYFEKWSVSSPAFKYVSNGTLDCLYEGRHSLEEHDDFRTGYCVIGLNTETIIRRNNKPISKERLVPDDIQFKDSYYWFSMHTRTDADKWFGLVYKSKFIDRDLKHAYTQTLDGKKIGEIYFTDSNKVYFYKKNFEGMWEGYLEQPQLPIGGDVLKLKVTSKDNNHVLLEWQHPQGVNNVHFERKSKKGNPIYLGTKDSYATGQWVFENTWKANEFRTRPETTNIWEEWVSIGEPPIDPPIDPPTDCDHTKALQHIENARTELNKAEEELRK